MKHGELLERAVHACRTREHFSPFPDRPGRDPDTQAAIETAHKEFESHLGGRVELDQPAIGELTAAETSPFTLRPLEVTYPATDAPTAFAAARQASGAWAALEPDQRVDLCLEMVWRLYERWFEIAHANQHTTGQSFSMSCVGSGVNALDRGIEAIAYAAEAMSRVPTTGRWQRDFGRTEVTLDKAYHLLPRGPAVVVTCASFPTWNAYPALFANLATGNPVVVKPHPTSVLTMALMVQVAQQVLAEAGLPTTLVQLAPDTVDEPITKELIEDPACRIVDFTGSPSFGSWIERNAHPAIAFTETAGVNTVVIDAVEDLAATASAIATSLGLFSAQMCTSVQNIY
ncbi:MAG: aldehyde dehydrogenase family protein, partial [Actinomycetota bacterium]